MNSARKTHRTRLNDKIRAIHAKKASETINAKTKELIQKNIFGKKNSLNCSQDKTRNKIKNKAPTINDI